MSTSTHNQNEISLVIPVFNEEQVIEEFIIELQSFIAKAKIEPEVIFVDDGSSDRTSERLAASNFTILTNPSNQGYGASLKRGILHARRKAVAIIDADGTYHLDDLTKLMPFCHTHDMVVGARALSAENFPLYQRLAKRLVCRWLSRKFKQDILDINSGLRLFKRDIVLKYLPLLPNGFSFTATITLAMLLDSYAIEYIDIPYKRRRGRSKISVAGYTFNFLKSYWRTLRLYRKPAWRESLLP